MFPRHVCLTINILMCGLVTAASTFTNGNAICERSLGEFNLELYGKAVSVHNMTLKAIRDCVDNYDRWVNYPNFL